jgi:hypothetical protein
VIDRHKFSVGKNFEVENFQLLTMMFSENFLSAEIFPKWKLAITPEGLSTSFLYSVVLGIKEFGGGGVEKH